jgi:hypothetical protein
MELSVRTSNIDKQDITMRMIGMIALVASGAVAGCSSTASTDDTNNGNTTACTVAFSGAISATSACTVSANYNLDVLGRSDFSILNTGTPGFTLGIQKDGKLSSGTFTASSPDVEMATTTASNAGLLWSQDTRDPVHGTISVNLTSASLGSDGYTLTVHGTADGTLTPSQATPSATGTVTVHAVF